MAALTTQSQLTASTAAEMSASVTAAINQLAANQQAMQQQFVAFATTRNTTYQPATLTPPPMQQFNIPNFGTFQPAGLGVGGRQGGQGVHLLQTSWDAVAKVDYPTLEAAVAEVLRRLHNKMHHVMRHRCIPTSSNGTQTGTFVSLAVLM
jgi:hypothetical protein